MTKKITALFLIIALTVFTLTGCGNSSSNDSTSAPSAPSSETQESSEEVSSQDSETEETTLTIAAAASLEYSFTEKLIPMFEEKNPGVKIEGVYDASGKLQTQIEEGLDADIFMSAATKQMTSLSEKNLIDTDSIIDLLENKIVLITSADSNTEVSSFEDISKANTIAIGDPESVPVGQYSQEALTKLGIWDNISEKFSLGTNVTEVLNWVAEGSADVGIVYATDAATTENVKVIAEAPDGSLEKKVLYPIGLVSSSKNKDLAKSFLEFLSSDDALAVFEEYGFTPNK